MLLQVRDGETYLRDTAPDNTTIQPIPFASKILTSAECRYSNIEREALGIQHTLEKFHHYCFARDVTITTDYKPLMAIFKKDVATLSQSIQHIIPGTHLYRIHIVYKPGPEIFIADWPSQHNHKENKDKVINGLDIRVDTVQVATNVLECMSI